MSKGGARYTHANLIAANLDEIVILGHTARAGLRDLVDHPAHFERQLHRYMAEAHDLATDTLHHVRERANP